MEKKVAILGATGSVGGSALKVIDALPGRFRVELLTANRSWRALLALAQYWRPKALAIGSRENAARLREALPGVRVVSGLDDLVALIADLELDFTLSAIVGAAGLRPTLQALEHGTDLGLANKESMVIAGDLVNRAAERSGSRILPIDSEHNALHQCLRGETRNEVKRLILTASGGPFRDFGGSFDKITPEQALDHPTWDMGPKITIDSATMMNKGLEVIEAHHLFGFPGEAIDIVVHPQSIVHSLIETVDGSYKCQLGKTDMCDPIQYALTYPERCANPFTGLDITKGMALSFFEADPVRFPCIRLAYDALRLGGAAPAVLNAANEISVAAFLERRLSFSGIARINESCLARLGDRCATTLDDILHLDAETRQMARSKIESG